MEAVIELDQEGVLEPGRQVGRVSTPVRDRGGRLVRDRCWCVESCTGDSSPRLAESFPPGQRAGLFRGQEKKEHVPFRERWGEFDGSP